MDPLKRIRRLRTNTHRWSEEETYQFILEVSKDVRKQPTVFLRPTAEKYYASVASRNKHLKHLSWTVMKAKLRHLRVIFMAEYDNPNLIAKKIPHYELLEIIFIKKKEMMQENCVESSTEFQNEDAEYGFADFQDDFSDFSNETENTLKNKKKTRLRLNETHHWSQEETTALINCIIKATAGDPKVFEKPSARAFYEANCKNGVLENIDWLTMKSKMRYFKILYLKAEKWLEEVGVELFKSDEKHIKSRLNSICPHYYAVKPIFESRRLVDPIIVAWEGNSANYHEDRQDNYHNENLFKMEEGSMDVEGAETSIIEGDGESDAEINYKKNMEHEADSDNQILTPKSEIKEVENRHLRKLTLEFQREKLDFEKRKFETEQANFEKQIELQKETLKLERDKLEFEKLKLSKEEDLKKYKIDQDFLLNKLRLEKEERLQKFELDFKYKGCEVQEELI